LDGTAVSLLALSLLALGIGPLWGALLRKTAWSADFLNGVVLVSLSGVVLLHVLPHTIEKAGWSAIAVAAGGFALPFIAERWRHGGNDGRASALLPVIVTSLGVHAFFDGAALVQHTGQAQDLYVATAVVLHRLPDGLAIWSVVSAVRGKRVAAWVLAALAGFTVLGFGLAGQVVGGAGVALLQAFVAGSVLHVVLHPSNAQDARAQVRAVAATMGALVGLGLTIFLTLAHPGGKSLATSKASTLLALALESGPAMLVAAAVVALVWWRCLGGKGRQAMHPR
jgi:zinc transporter ZupT